MNDWVTRAWAKVNAGCLAAMEFRGGGRGSRVFSGVLGVLKRFNLPWLGEYSILSCTVLYQIGHVHYLEQEQVDRWHAALTECEFISLPIVQIRYRGQFKQLQVDLNDVDA